MLQLLPVTRLQRRLLALLVVLAPVAAFAQSTNNLNEDFTSGTTSNSWFYFNGACLTAGSGTGGSNPGQSVGTDSKGNATYYLPGCTKSSYYSETLVGGENGYLGATSAPASADEAGHGALRFTNGNPGGYHQNGAIVSAGTFAMGQGLAVTFKTVTYLGDSGGTGGDGADGISFYLLDGCMPIAGASTSGCPSNAIYGNSTFPAIGAWGGSLAYTCSNANPPYDGLVGAYLGLGIDEYGNFLNGVNNTLGETGSDGTRAGDNTASGGYYQPGRIGLRGAGSVSFAALSTAYGTYTTSSSPYYPASLATTCSNGGVYSNGSCGTTCSAGFFYNSGNNKCEQCPAGTQWYSGDNKCYSCPNGATYDATNNSCSNPSYTCPNGSTYSSGSCTPAQYCATGTLASGYCDYVCPTNYTTLMKTSGAYVGTAPQLCWSCSNSGTLDPSKLSVTSSGTAKCSSGSLKNVKLVAATANTPSRVLPQAQTVTTSTPSSGVPISLLATQKTCRTGHLWNYNNPGSPTDAGPATLPSDPTNANPLNTAGILDYPALPNAYSVLPSTTKIANEGATTRGAATPIFYNLKITQNGLLTLSYSTGGGAYTNVINGLDITKSNGPLPSTLRFGFAGSTGGSTNIHEIMCFKAAPDTLSASSVGVNEKQSSDVKSDTQAFFAYYNPVDSTGRVAGFSVGFDSNNKLVVSSKANWDAACVLTGVAAGDTCPTTLAAGYSAAESPSPSSTGRQIITWNGSAGTAFEWGNISAAQQAALGTSDEVDYLRGVRTKEVNSQGVGTFRARDNVLGDVVDSSPTWVGAPSQSYTTTFRDRINPSDPLYENAATAQTYVQFKSAWLTRQNLVFDGANDGMLHAFRTMAADGSGTNDGHEVFAYMPGYVTQTIHTVSSNSDGSTNSSLDFSSPSYIHNFFVDATPGSGDLFYNDSWHSWLAGGLGAGGAAFYILDITDPANLNESKAASLVVGEWVAGNDTVPGAINCSGNGLSNNTDCGLNLGNVTGAPLIRRLHNGTWGVIFGNGLGSATGDAGIYILTIDPKTQAKNWYYLSTGKGSLGTPGTDGMSAAASIDLDGDKITDYVYAGDALGNLWRFDLTSGDPSKWAVGSVPVFSAAGQPITTAAVVGGPQDSTGGLRRVMVVFGTGRKTPFTATSPNQWLSNTQNLYGVWDWDMSAWNALASVQFASLAASATGLGTGSIAPANLHAQTVTLDADGKTRDITGAPPCYKGTTSASCTSSSDFGWTYSLIGSDSQGTEQVVANPTFVNGKVVFNTQMPADNIPTSCTNNTDKGWTYNTDMATGLPTPGFFPQYYDTSTQTGNAAAGGVETDASGSSFLLNSADGTSWLVYQTVTNQHDTLQVSPPANGTSRRLTWTQLR
jgi:type IV pilus assembly protein PilY1